MAVELELGRSAFLSPALVRAVRAMGVQARLDVDRLEDISLAAEAIAECWMRGASAEPLRVALSARDGGIDVSFGFADPGEPARIRTECLPAAAPARVAGAVTLSAGEDASRLVLAVG